VAVYICHSLYMSTLAYYTSFFSAISIVWNCLTPIISFIFYFFTVHLKYSSW
jgi:hypothetical protein